MKKILMRRLSDGRAHIPLAGDARRLSVVQGVTIAIAAGFVLIVAVADDLGIRLLFGAFSLLLVAIAVYVGCLRRLLETGVVRIDTRGPGLRFQPPVWPTAFLVAILLLLALPAVAVVVIGDAGEVLSPRRSPLLLPVFSAICLAVMIWRLRVPAGLRLTVDGIRGIRARGDLAWSWDEVGEVGVDGPPAALTLTRKDGYVPVTASMRYLGSDPNQVATIVRFFRDHPEERAILARGGQAALDRAADALRPLD